MDEAKYLAELQGRPAHRRLLGYIRLSGPGYMQSAMTLGGGSIASCMVFGSLMGYELLWVQPLAMLLGCVVLAAVAKQVTHTGERPYQAIWDRLHPSLAILWGVAALTSTIIWHFPQYTLTANGIVSLAEGVGLDLGAAPGRPVRNGLIHLLIGGGLLGAAVLVVRMYYAGARGVRHFEFATKLLVWTIVAAFAVVAIGTGIDLRRFLLGITGISFVQNLLDGGIDSRAVVPIVGGMAAALGINMVFLYPYSLLNKRWGKPYTGLAYFDLVAGMALPFFLATAFMVLAVANTIGPAEGETGEVTRNIMDIVPVLGPAFGQVLGNPAAGDAAALWLIGLGMIAVGFTSIIMHMLACGFIGCEVFGYAHESRARFWFSLAPVIGVYGVTLQGLPWQAAITASSLNAPLLPVTVACFLVLLNLKSFMGDARPEGFRRALWCLGLGASILVMSTAAYFGLTGNWARLRAEWLDARAAAEAIEEAPAADAEEWEEADPLLEEWPALPMDRLDLRHVRLAHGAMGSLFELFLYGEAERLDDTLLTQAGRRAFAEIDALEAEISSWQEDSETSAINRNAGIAPVAAGERLWETLEAARTAYEQTGGAFDVTVGPLVDLWREAEAADRVPAETEIAEALERVGFQHVQMDEDARTVYLDRPGMRLDFGGIGKGQALDVAAAQLRRYGVRRALIHGGTSSVVAIGAPPGAGGWTISIRNPYSMDSEPVAEVEIRDEALSTSAASEALLQRDGARYGHIYDPVTGAPATGVISATAIAPDGMRSDALSTAFFVMGVAGTQAYCEAHPEVRALLVLAEDGVPRPMRINF